MKLGFLQLPAAIVLFVAALLAVAYIGNLIGYAIFIACLLSFLGLLVSLLWSARDMVKALKAHLSRESLLLLLAILVIFTLLSTYVFPKSELVYFDENIYQGIALNILHSGNALSCIYGTAYVQKCFTTNLGFDPEGWPFLIAVAFGMFGISNVTSYALELFMALVSIVGVFLIASMLSDRKEVGVISAAAFALIPELFIWAGTVASPDLPFMAFAVLDLVFFLVFLKQRNVRTLSLVAFSTAFTVYFRLEALLLVPIFAILYVAFSWPSGRKHAVRAASKQISGTRVYLVLLASLLILVPQLVASLETAPELQANAAFYLYPNTATFSASYVLPNLLANAKFLAGFIFEYPIIFIPSITVFAIIGAASLLLDKSYKNGRRTLLALLLFFFAYFCVYLFYFSGSVLVGVSVRYLLIIYPPMAILSAFGISSISRFASSKNTQLGYIIATAILIVFFVVPFVHAAATLAKPSYSYYGFPLNNVTANLTGVNPYTTQYSKNDIAFIDNSSHLVPSNCLVMSELPSVWFMLNRSSSYLPPQTDLFTNQAYSGYGCYYLDYDFWCTVSPYNTTVCKFYTTDYKLRLVATEPDGAGSNFSLYQLLNYTPQ